MRAHKNKEEIVLPDYIKLSPKYPGENNFLRKRRFPASVRFHKKRQDVDPHKFFLSELMLYFPFRDENKDLHADSEELCAQLYLREYDNNCRVKAETMRHFNNVEEARFMVDEYLKNKKLKNEIGLDLDP